MLKLFRHGVGRNWNGVLICLLLGTGLFVPPNVWAGNSAPTLSSISIPANASPELTEFLQNRATLAAKLAKFNSQSTGGSNSQTLTQFQQQNDGLLARQNQLALIISQQQQPNALPSPPALSVPPNAPPEMKEFLQNRATLAAKMAQFSSQNVGGSNSQTLTQFQQQNAGLLARQNQLAQIISQQRNPNPLPQPPPLQIPPNASPQLQAFLKTRDQLVRGQATVMNQHRSDDPATQEAALAQWRQQNAALIQQFQQEAQAMTQNEPSRPPAVN